MKPYVPQPNTVYVAVNPVYNVIGTYATRTVLHYDVLVVQQEPARAEAHKLHHAEMRSIEKTLVGVTTRTQWSDGRRSYEHVPTATAVALGIWNSEKEQINEA
jgi:hypothetical protein